MENRPRVNSINVLINGKDITLKMIDAEMLRDILVELLGPSVPTYTFGPISDEMQYKYTDTDGIYNTGTTSDWSTL